MKCVFAGPSNRSNSVSSLDLEGESVSELGAGPSGSNGVEALQLLEHEQGRCQLPLQVPGLLYMLKSNSLGEEVVN